MLPNHEHKKLVMNFPWTLVVAGVMLHLAASVELNALPPNKSDDPVNRWNGETESAIKERLPQIRLPFEPKYNARVRNYIKDYVVIGYRQTEEMLGHSIRYFPIFEHYLTVNRLPKELMYLPIVESGLDPTAKSPAGAAGLWQLMSATARQYGLRIDGQVDERLDPYRSTEVAVRILADLYAQFGDWRLVLAAYNCGPGKVLAAMRASGCKDYWSLEPHLPAETRRYVPSYIAAAYVFSFYHHHDLTPKYPALNLRETRVLKVYQGLTFQQIATACGVSPTTISTLNPAYVQRTVPKSTKGHYVIVPANAATAFKEFLASRSNASLAAVTGPPNTFKSTYVVAKGDRIEQLARLFQCSIEDIIRWNGLSNSKIFINQELTVYLPSELLPKRA